MKLFNNLTITKVSNEDLNDSLEISMESINDQGIVISDIPNLYDKNSRYYREYIKPRNYKKFSKYKVIKNKGILNINKNKYVEPSKDQYGYACCSIYDDDNTLHNKRFHIIMADAFIVNNPECLPVVNHEDGDKMNFKLKNLKRCTSKYNREHAIKTGLVKTKDNS